MQFLRREIFYYDLKILKERQINLILKRVSQQGTAKNQSRTINIKKLKNRKPKQSFYFTCCSAVTPSYVQTDQCNGVVQAEMHKFQLIPHVVLKKETLHTCTSYILAHVIEITYKIYIMPVRVSK